jgi:aspartyl-tRNA(Asn)/glutamyl-tRNA(Gln) amidotransferase subunit C
MLQHEKNSINNNSFGVSSFYVKKAVPQASYFICKLNVIAIIYWIYSFRCFCMNVSAKDLDKISQLAYLDIDNSPKLVEEINSIMNFVNQLSTVDTQGIAPLFHPLALNQRLRTDVISEENCLPALAAIAPKFDKNLYLVPQVIDQSK